MADLKLKDFVDENDLQKLVELDNTIERVRADYVNAAKELAKGLKLNVEGVSYLPVIVPTIVPLIAILTPGISIPPASTTFPETETWANICNPIQDRRPKNNRIRLFIITIIKVKHYLQIFILKKKQNHKEWYFYTVF